MLKRLKLGRPSLLAIVGLLLAAILIGVAFGDSFFRMSIRPSGGFDAAAAPAVADYSLPSSWAMRPATPPPGGWETPWGVDVFFIHPTTAYAGNGWNAATDDRAAIDRLDASVLPNLAGPFAKAGPVYAPHYRQATLHSDLSVEASSEKALLLAYEDILGSFDAYMTADNRGRGVVLVGYGQGALHAARLLRDRFQDEPAKERLAVAYLIDGGTSVDVVGGPVSQKACERHDDIHCIVAWTTLIDGDSGQRRRFERTSPSWSATGGIVPTAGRKLLCVNPLLWTVSTDLAPKGDHRGAARVGPNDDDPTILAKLVSARCGDGALVVDRPSAPSLQPSGGWGARYKSPGYNLFYADLMYNSAERARAASVWLDQFGRKPATPLPPPLALPDAPIYRPGGVVDPVQ
ncbi:MAG: DUF3089 domain-containing protein [Alphaproteobacteria bacterium]|nr:DUF3089 domain-containing protein [Alphaproteobacteria bacterium]